MKVKLTPLNIISALSIMAVGGLIAKKEWILGAGNHEFKNPLIALCILVFFVSLLCDQIFRKFIPSLARLWMTQLMLILLTVLFVLVLKLSVFG
ncbi:hypothetical protein [Nubsella zeaxanthinifaciens]|uniref:hypothetical protein n=1 Tax=Nubsella zeaxanthinifaciens TaxID=392412 RepID=UPI000DE4F126|nr:hypothetical protein [Nubsella zeaxanthinifaciens]